MRILFLLIFSFSQAQFFENPSDENENFGTSPTEYNETPDQGTDARGDDDFPTGPGEVPINNWLFLLPLAALAIGSHQLLKNKQERI
jgi:hypothetical protein